MGVTFSASKSDGDSTSSHGVNFLDLLAILFIGLKLTGHIDWSWWGVLAPIWGPWLLAGAIVAIVGSIALVAEWLKR